MATEQQALIFRTPNVVDGKAMFDCVRQCPPLEVNTEYAYLLFATHFKEASAIVTDESGIVGFVAGYRVPAEPSALFVWQIAVHARARGRGVAKRLLNHLIERPAPTPVRYIEATVAPSNTASQHLFRGLAREWNVRCEERPFFESEHFGGGNHEPEALFRVGPFSQAPCNTENHSNERSG